MSLPDTLHLRHGRGPCAGGNLFDGYKVTLTLTATGEYAGVWRYPLQPGVTRRSLGWSPEVIESLIRRREWVYDYPPHVAVPEGL